jgi:3-deoxy-D-manno-octulosonate 8-phosphate phosphatase (KDO 8-P phosphatase)
MNNHTITQPPNNLRTLADRCNAIELLVMDVDGVLTDGGIVYGSGGLEVKHFHVRDGSGLHAWHRAGNCRSAIVTGRSAPLVQSRADEMGVAFVIQGAADKLAALRSLLERAAVKATAVCYVGDDLPDLPPMRHCGLAVAVADACPEVRAGAHHVTRAPGGRGAVRETVELMLRCRGEWSAPGGR